MYSPVQLALKFAQYYLTSSNGKGHGIHSPFVFNFVQQVLNDQRHFYAYEAIENRRKWLLQNNEVLTIEDFGAGSRTGLTKQRKVKDIAASSLKPKKYAQLLFRMVDYYQPKTIIELGTSLGITSSYLASAKQDAEFITFEGSKAVAAVAKNNFSNLGLNNIRLIEGNFDKTLKPTLNTLLVDVDFAFLDGNHRYQPTIDYFNQLLPHLNEHSVVIFDDIHWSKEMEQAWYEIQQNNMVTLSIDLFFVGLVFFKKDFKVKQHFSIRF
jgi:predicted O-methyltransferase YrrM